MSYADITFCDQNPIKRWLQQRRLADAIQLTAHFQGINTVLDFGAGNGELSKRLINFFPKAHIICYEPTFDLMAEAQMMRVVPPTCSDFVDWAGLRRESNSGT